MFGLVLGGWIFKKFLKMAELDMFYFSKNVFNTTFEVSIRKVPPNSAIQFFVQTTKISFYQRNIDKNQSEF